MFWVRHFLSMETPGFDLPMFFFVSIKPKYGPRNKPMVIYSVKKLDYNCLMNESFDKWQIVLVFFNDVV